LEPKLQIEMQGEEAVNLREAISILTHAGLRLFRRRRSS
jgi:hypothetical protein